MFYAVFFGGRCIAKVVWDGHTYYECPFQHDDIVEDADNAIPVIPEEPEGE